MDFFGMDLYFLSIKKTLSGQTFLRSTCGPKYNNFLNVKGNWKLLYNQSWYHLWCIFNFLFNFLKCLSVVFNNMHLNFISIPSEMSGWTFLGSSLVQGYKDSIIWRKKEGIILSLFDMNLIKIIGHLEFLKILKIIISRPPSWAQKSLTSQRLSYGLKMKIHTKCATKRHFKTKI